MDGLEYKNSWNKLKDEFQDLKGNYDKLRELQAEAKKLEASCATLSSKQLKKVKALKKEFKKSNVSEESPAGKEALEMEESLGKMRETLPGPNNLFLRSIVGSINVTLPNKEDKLTYKERYENFKRNVTIIICIMSVIAIWMKDYSRLPGSIMQFVLAWFYLAMTVREQILLKNGSKIATWWIVHHYISIIIAGVIILWPEGECYHYFQAQFLYFTLSLSIIMYMQFIYQKSQLYKLRTLGKATQMDIVQDAGIRSKSMGDLGFLVPFLFFTYMFQLYNSIKLYQMWTEMQDCQLLWQVPVLCVLFLLIAVGNTWTLLAVLLKKFRSH